MGCKPSSLRCRPERHQSPYAHTTHNTTGKPSNKTTNNCPYPVQPRGSSTDHAHPYPRHRASTRSLRPSGSRLLHSLSTLSLSGAERADSLFEYDWRVDRPARVVSIEELRLRGKTSVGEDKLRVGWKEGMKNGGGKNGGMEAVGLPRRSTLPMLLVARSGEDLRRENRVMEEGLRRESRIMEEE